MCNGRCKSKAWPFHIMSNLSINIVVLFVTNTAGKASLNEAGIIGVLI